MDGSRYFNPRSPHGERRDDWKKLFAKAYFNPRSPHGERPRQRVTPPNAKGISIHAPRTGSDIVFNGPIIGTIKFQSTLPARGATPPHPLLPHPQKTFQSTLPARGATPSTAIPYADALRFQSTLPARGATYYTIVNLFCQYISIHAPRTGSDPRSRCRGAASWDFNPRSPHGERRQEARRSGAPR